MCCIDFGAQGIETKRLLSAAFFEPLRASKGEGSLWIACGLTLALSPASPEVRAPSPGLDRLTPEIFFTKAHKGPCQRGKPQA